MAQTWDLDGPFDNVGDVTDYAPSFLGWGKYRHEPFPVLYPGNPTGFKADIITAGIITFYLVLVVGFLAILPSFNLNLKTVAAYFMIAVQMLIGATCMISIWEPGWEVGHIKTKMEYAQYSGDEIYADLGLYIGLRGINITLVGDPIVQHDQIIDYNEEFSWVWAQGRIGFGRWSNRFNREFRAAQYQGMPTPILGVAEFFTLDGESIRWGRYYRQSGYFAHMFIWGALSLWLLSNILYAISFPAGFLFTGLTGVSMEIAIFIYGVLLNRQTPKIQFRFHAVDENDPESGWLRTHKGEMFWMVLIVGLLAIGVGFSGFTLLRYKVVEHPLIAETVLEEQKRLFSGVDEKDDDEEEEEESNEKKPSMVMKPLGRQHSKLSNKEN
eukprot:Lithocolla_globosa_v1_NODE_5197_length_1284_cov_98.274207.p1 type:complete len:383 gc:universal NODE_5197_length_1284_cov_98.274207:100-1248(+)